LRRLLAARPEYQTAWREIILSYASTVAETPIYCVLAILACSLVFFDPSDRVYLWISAVFLITAANLACECLFAWTLTATQRNLYLVLDGVFSPLILSGWVMTWWFWFRLRRPPWVPKAVVALALAYGFSNPFGEDLFITLIPHSVSAILHLFAIAIRLSFLALLILISLPHRRVQRRGSQSTRKITGLESSKSAKAEIAAGAFSMSAAARHYTSIAVNV
jgi:hypothetical protein